MSAVSSARPWRRHNDGRVLTPLEATALKWIVVHPECPGLLADEVHAFAEEFTVERGQTHPLLHRSMHRALEEQLSIDPPHGSVAAFRRLLARSGDEHAAAHEAIECLGEDVWNAPRSTVSADPAAINAAYLDCLQRHAGR